MSRKFMKPILFLFLLILSPVVLVLLASSAVMIVFLLSGDTVESAVEFLRAGFIFLSPHLPYITGVPALLGVSGVLIKNRKKILGLFNKS